MLGPRVNVIVDSGPFHIRPSGIPSDHQPKGTRGDSSLVAIPASITRYAALPLANPQHNATLRRHDWHFTSPHRTAFYSPPFRRSASPCCEVFFSFILFTTCRQGASRLDFREMLPGVKFCHEVIQPHVKYKKVLNIIKIFTRSTKTELKTGKKNCKKFH